MSHSNDIDLGSVLAECLTKVFGTGTTATSGGPWDDSVLETARRIIGYWHEYVPTKDLPFEFTTFEAKHDQMIVVKDIDFASVCAHHLLPFYGTACVGYVPHGRIVGLSKIPRLVDFFAHRPQLQERLTYQIMRYIKEALGAKGVGVVIKARHTCMACRGVRKHTGLMITSAMDGVFLTAPTAKQEFMELIK